MPIRFVVTVCLMVAMLASACSTAAPAPTATQAPAAPTKAAGPAPTQAPAAAPTQASAAAPTQASAASTYPNKPITFVVPYAAGQGPDLVSRYLADQMEKALGQKIVVEDRAGAGSAIGLGEIQTAKPDGYTIGLGFTWAVVWLPVTQDTPFKGMGDFTAISGFYQTNGGLIVAADNAKYKTLQDLFADAKQRPGKVSMGVQGVLKGMGHIQLLQVAKWGGNVQFNLIPHSSDATPDLLGGTYEAAYEGTSTTLPQVQAGKLRFLFVNLGVPELKGVPTAEELGAQIVHARSIVLGPKGMPADITAKLHDTVKKIVESKDFIDVTAKIGVMPFYQSGATIESRAKTELDLLTQTGTEQGWPLRKP